MPADSVDRLQRLMIDGGEKAFDLVPTTLANVITERRWAEKHDRHGVLFESFEQFVAYPLRWGLGSTIDDLRAHCRKRPDVDKLLMSEVGVLAEHGANQHTGDSNTTSSDDRGATYTLRRLKRDRPDLAEKVINGELSAHAAAIDAGFRKRLSAYEQIMKLLPKLNDEERSQLRRLLA